MFGLRNQKLLLLNSVLWVNPTVIRLDEMRTWSSQYFQLLVSSWFFFSKNDNRHYGRSRKTPFPLKQN